MQVNDSPRPIREFHLQDNCYIKAHARAENNYILHNLKFGTNGTAITRRLRGQRETTEHAKKTLKNT